jgi:phage tail-like protein
MATPLTPLHIFRFHVVFYSDSVNDDDTNEFMEVCSGAFSECTGLEATMEPKAIKEGGNNFGTQQRAGPITFGTVVLKRGISGKRNLWAIFNSFASGYARRMMVFIWLLDGDQKYTFGWRLDRAMPVKFKFADLNAKGTEVGIEELHLVHEGLYAA